MSGVLHRPEDIQRFRIAALRQALKLEMVGMRPRLPTDLECRVFAEARMIARERFEAEMETR